ncbi:hypothetical protein B0J18DRAFT_485896 [Chaetomium sp. MPI-SDFR-AT-0129]|nr:hypothetical protein B0J18DRAFT_485896 [Chaetomium sp. MPI-SDFR-AT-0129]
MESEESTYCKDLFGNATDEGKEVLAKLVYYHELKTIKLSEPLVTNTRLTTVLVSKRHPAQVPPAPDPPAPAPAPAPAPQAPSPAPGQPGPSSWAAGAAKAVVTKHVATRNKRNGNRVGGRWSRGVGYWPRMIAKVLMAKMASTTGGEEMDMKFDFRETNSDDEKDGPGVGDGNGNGNGEDGVGGGGGGDDVFDAADLEDQFSRLPDSSGNDGVRGEDAEESDKSPLFTDDEDPDGGDASPVDDVPAIPEPPPVIHPELTLPRAPPHPPHRYEFTEIRNEIGYTGDYKEEFPSEVWTAIRPFRLLTDPKHPPSAADSTATWKDQRTMLGGPDWLDTYIRHTRHLLLFNGYPLVEDVVFLKHPNIWINCDDQPKNPAVEGNKAIVDGNSYWTALALLIYGEASAWGRVKCEHLYHLEDVLKNKEHPRHAAYTALNRASRLKTVAYGRNKKKKKLYASLWDALQIPGCWATMEACQLTADLYKLYVVLYKYQWTHHHVYDMKTFGAYNSRHIFLSYTRGNHFFQPMIPNEYLHYEFKLPRITRQNTKNYLFETTPPQSQDGRSIIADGPNHYLRGIAELAPPALAQPHLSNTMPPRVFGYWAIDKHGKRILTDPTVLDAAHAVPGDEHLPREMCVSRQRGQKRKRNDGAGDDGHEHSTGQPPKRPCHETGIVSNPTTSQEQPAPPSAAPVPAPAPAPAPPQQPPQPPPQPPPDDSYAAATDNQFRNVPLPCIRNWADALLVLQPPDNSQRWTKADCKNELELVGVVEISGSVSGKKGHWVRWAGTQNGVYIRPAPPPTRRQKQVAPAQPGVGAQPPPPPPRPTPGLNFVYPDGNLLRIVPVVTQRLWIRSLGPGSEAETMLWDRGQCTAYLRGSRIEVGGITPGGPVGEHWIQERDLQGVVMRLVYISADNRARVLEGPGAEGIPGEAAAEGSTAGQGAWEAEQARQAAAQAAAEQQRFQQTHAQQTSQPAAPQPGEIPEREMTDEEFKQWSEQFDGGGDTGKPNSKDSPKSEISVED